MMIQVEKDRQTDRQTDTQGEREREREKAHSWTDVSSNKQTAACFQISTRLPHSVLITIQSPTNLFPLGPSKVVKFREA